MWQKCEEDGATWAIFVFLICLVLISLVSGYVCDDWKSVQAKIRAARLHRLAAAQLSSLTPTARKLAPFALVIRTMGPLAHLFVFISSSWCSYPSEASSLLIMTLITICMLRLAHATSAWILKTAWLQATELNMSVAMQVVWLCASSCNVQSLLFLESHSLGYRGILLPLQFTNRVHRIGTMLSFIEVCFHLIFEIWMIVLTGFNAVLLSSMLMAVALLLITALPFCSHTCATRSTRIAPDTTLDVVIDGSDCDSEIWNDWYRAETIDDLFSSDDDKVESDYDISPEEVQNRINELRVHWREERKEKRAKMAAQRHVILTEKQLAYQAKRHGGTDCKCHDCIHYT